MSIKENYNNIISKLPSHVTLVAASKAKSPEIIKEAYDAGQMIFGENYVQELEKKYTSPLLRDLDIEWHFIGNLQRNKVKHIIDKVSLIQSVSNIKLAHEINKRAKAISKVQNILVEINIGDEDSKGGVNINEINSLVEEVKASSNLKLKGLMILPPFLDDPVELRPYFKQTKTIFDQIGSLDILSMGMSGDWEEAIKYGSNMVRIGTALLGAR